MRWTTFPHSNPTYRKMKTYVKPIAKVFSAIVVSSGLLLTSCQTHTQQGALVGGLGGAAIGGIAGGGEGALIGGALGAAGGAALGSAKDRRYGPRY